MEVLGHLHEVGAVRQDAPLPGQPMLFLVRKALEQLIGDDEGEHRIAQELQALIVGRACGAMPQCLLQQRAVLETVTDEALQLLPGEIHATLPSCAGKVVRSHKNPFNRYGHTSTKVVSCWSSASVSMGSSARSARR